MKLYIFILSVFFTSCTRQQVKKDSKTNQETQTIFKVARDSSNKNTEIIEIFIDSLNIGEKGNNKIEIIKHRVFDNNYVIVKFYTKGPNYWYVQNTYLYECDAAVGLYPDISDFNNDKHNDITFVSATAARAANEARRLFIYDEQNNELVSIVNSQEFPNMQYNAELNCIDAFMIHGGSTTVFARIEKDSLKEFASVNCDNNITVYEIDKFDKEKVLRKDTIVDFETIYMRYKNYKPLKKYTE